MVLSVKEFEKCCRCCLLVTDTVPLFSIFDYMHSANIYNEFTALNATKDDGLPQQICQNCIRKLNYAFNFKRMMLDSHKKMIEIVKNFCDSRLESHIDTESVAFDEGKNAQHDIQSDSQIPDSEIKQEPTTEYFYEYDPVSTTSSVSQDTSRNEECQNLTTRNRDDLEEAINKQTSVDRLNTENNVEYQSSNNGTGIELISKEEEFQGNELEKQAQRQTRKHRIEEGKAIKPSANRPSTVKRQASDLTEECSQRPAKRQNLRPEEDKGLKQAARKTNLEVAICRVDGESVSLDLAKLIRKKLLELIGAAIMAETNSRCLTFITSRLEKEGFFLVTPEREESMEWLTSCTFGVIDGVEIVPRKLDSDRVRVWIPGPESESTLSPMAYLAGQNAHCEDLRLKEWTLLSKSVSPEGIALIIAVPKEDLEAWKGEDVLWLYYQDICVSAGIIHSEVTTTPHAS